MLCIAQTTSNGSRIVMNGVSMGVQSNEVSVVNS